MKKYLAVSILFIALPSHAQFATQQGISGEISLNAGVGYVVPVHCQAHCQAVGRGYFNWQRWWHKVPV